MSNNNDQPQDTIKVPVSVILDQQEQQPLQQPLQQIRSSQTPFMEKWNNYVKKFTESHQGRAPHLVILTPCYGSVCYVGYIQSLIQTLTFMSTLGVAVSVEFCRNDSLVTRARNGLVAKAMSDPKCTHMMFLDSDLTWNPADIALLMMHDKLLVGGLYPLKHYFFDKFMTASGLNKDEFDKLVQRYQASPYCKDQPFHVFFQQNILRYNCNYLSNVVEIDHNLVKLRHIATGFMMIQRECIEQMMARYPERKYKDDVGGFLTEKQDPYTYNLFSAEVVDGHLFSEDWFFCHLWHNEMKGEVFGDVSINLTHTGPVDFQGSYLRSLL